MLPTKLECATVSTSATAAAKLPTKHTCTRKAAACSHTLPFPFQHKHVSAADCLQHKSHAVGLSRLSRNTSIWVSAHSEHGSQAHAPNHEHSHMTPLDTTSKAVFGARGMLLVGFDKHDGKKVEEWFARMEPGFPISYCSNAMVHVPLGEAVYTSDGSFCQVPYQADEEREPLPRLAFFSGLNGEETVAIMENWELLADCPAPVFVSILESLTSQTVSALIESAMRSSLSSRRAMKEGGVESFKEQLDSSGLREALVRKIEEKKRNKSAGPITLDLSKEGQTQAGAQHSKVANEPVIVLDAEDKDDVELELLMKRFPKDQKDRKGSSEGFS